MRDLHPARLATEKAVFRPALPKCLMSGITEMRMSYFEKMKDPRWQKKRLEVLEDRKWLCEICGDTESTLHVHHKQYFKGRDPWEYEIGQLSALCEKCHKELHVDEDELLLAASFVVHDGPYSRLTLASLIAGYAGQGIDNTYVSDPEAYILGSFADAIDIYSPDGLKIHELVRLVEVANKDRPGLIKALRDFVTSHGGDHSDA